MPNKKNYGDNPIVIKKYANRRLYNTDTSIYVTLEDLCDMVKRGEEFVVYDAKSGDDITRAVLTQVIVEQEAKGQNLLPINFLRRLIGFYDDSMRGILPQYLEASIDAFVKNQDNMRDMLSQTFGGMFPYQQMEEISKRNFEIFEQALNTMFTPFLPNEDKKEDKK